MEELKRNKIIHGDSLQVLKKLPDNSVDLVCTDPPYGYSFMGKSWDKVLPHADIFKECLRVLKPGAFAFVMSAPRSDVLSRMIVRIEDAGFRVDFTPIYWTYASGFPKAMNIGKMVDKRSGKPQPTTYVPNNLNTVYGRGRGGGRTDSSRPQTDEAKSLQGSYGGFQPKPAVEVIIVAMKPLSEKTFVDQALKNGKGITWLDDGRIPGEERDNTPMGTPANSYGGFVAKNPTTTTTTRFPANLLVSDEILNGHSKFFSLDEWAKTFPFLAVPKASKGEKNRGLGFNPIDNSDSYNGKFPQSKAVRLALNKHPTVKPLSLMSYLITLGSRPNDLILDPFLGSGTTAIAAKMLGRDFIGIEREKEYVKIAEARLKATRQSPQLFHN